MNNERRSHVTNIYLGTMATSANSVVPGIYFRKHSRIKKVTYIDNQNISKSNSNHLTLTLQDNAATPVSYAAADTSDTAVTALTPYDLPITTNAGEANQKEADVPAGTMLNFKVGQTGSAIPTLAVVSVEWYDL